MKPRFRLPPLDRLLRTLVLGLLALAIVGKPVLAELCDAHALSHLAAAAEGATAGKHVDSLAEARSDSDHASGKHQILHASDASPAYVEPFPALTVPPSRFAATLPQGFDESAPPSRSFDSPFRPPIA